MIYEFDLVVSEFLVGKFPYRKSRLNPNKGLRKYETNAPRKSMSFEQKTSPLQRDKVAVQTIFATCKIAIPI
jgi:hypothetical protein